MLAAALASPGPAQAQAATAVLRIRLLDGADPVGGAVLAVDGPEARRTATTDSRGVATVLHLRPGLYRVHATTPDGRFADALVRVGTGGTTQVGMPVPVAGMEMVETPVLRGSSARGAFVTEDELRGVPRPADPWSLARDVPGVVLDRVDVGGSDTGQQSLLVSGGDPGTGATWSIDGVDVTDPAAVGSTSIYPDMDSLSTVEVRTSALDVRVRTPGAQVSLFTRDTAPRWAGRAHARGTGLQSDNIPSALAGKSLVRNQTQRVTGFGGELGGPLAGDRGTLWAAWGRNAIRQETFTGHDDTTSTTDFTARARARVGAGTISLLGLRAEKVDDDRDVSLSASPESRWRQSGPAHLLAVEDRRDVGALSLLTHVSYLDAGFRLEPHGGTTQSAYEDFRGVFQRSYQRFETDRPRFEAGTEASAHGRALGFDHVLLGGGVHQRSVVSTDASWPGNQVLAYERQSVFFRAFGLTGFALPTRGQSARSLQQDWAGYAQDEARRGRFGVTLGLRLERAAGRNLSSSVEANPAFPDLLPAARYAGGPTEIRWLDLLPRAGVSWDLDREGRTVARLSYAVFADPLGSADITSDNPLADGASLSYYWIDRNGDHTVERGELDPVRGLLGASGVDPSAPGTVSSPQAIAPGLRAPRTSDLSFALEHGRGARAHAV
ncbi:MAG TPA: hypothetical protein VGQ33_03040, partial [Vicinamibacteria bacterium]|nr:hypothetical protein [Vicinamibacteria bacterium]